MIETVATSPITIETTQNPPAETPIDRAAEKLNKAYAMARGEQPQEEIASAPPPAIAPITEEKKPEEKVGSQFAALKRQKIALAKKEREIESKLSLVKEHESLEELRKTNPLEWARKAGLDPRQWAMEVMKQQQPTQEQLEILELKKQLAEFKANQEKQTQEQQIMQAQTYALAAIGEEYNKEANKYTTINAFIENGDFTPKDVCKQALDILEEQLQELEKKERERITDANEWALKNLPAVFSYIEDQLKENLLRERVRLERAGLLPKPEAEKPAEKTAEAQVISPAISEQRKVGSTTLSNSDAQQRASIKPKLSAEEKLELAYKMAKEMGV
jgi:hypothetical protein